MSKCGKCLAGRNSALVSRSCTCKKPNVTEPPKPLKRPNTVEYRKSVEGAFPSVAMLILIITISILFGASL